MPAIITPNKTDQERKRRLEDNDNGSGRRPPTDKRTGGGGDNDNWNDRPNGRRGPNERLHRYRLGIFFALASDLMFFVAIISTFFVNQSSGHIDAYNHYVNTWLPTAIPPCSTRMYMDSARARIPGGDIVCAATLKHASDVGFGAHVIHPRSSGRGHIEAIGYCRCEFS